VEGEIMKVLLLVLVFSVALLALDTGAEEYAGRGGRGAWESVFRVRCALTTPAGQREVDVGTAFGHKSGNVISAYHVVEECLHFNGSVKLAAADGNVSSAAVLISDSDLDLVLLKPDEGFVKNPFPIASGDWHTTGAQVTSWGFPAGYTWKAPLLTVGYLAGSVFDSQHPSIERWVVNAAINKGNSGGPLLETATPSVIGVVIQKLLPLTTEVESQLKTLSKSGSPEVKVLAQAMLHIAERSQLVIAYTVLTKDLRGFLQRGGVEP
jgi:S1-C subfamily serine protease